MKVIQLAGYAAPYGGSFASMLRAICAEARSRGWESALVLPEEARGRDWVAALESEGLEVVLEGPGSRAAVAGRLERLLPAEGTPVVLHSHFTQFDLAAARLAARRERTAVVWHLHSRLVPGALAHVRNRLKFAAFTRGVDRLLCVADNIAEAATARGAPRGRTVVWPNAIDVERFAIPGPEARLEARRALGLPEEGTVAMHFGWDWERKGGDLYVEAIRGLRAGPGGPELTAATVGGPAGAEGLVVLEPRERVQTFYEAADLFVSCSRAEGMPFAMAEALASGLGVVATDIPGQVAIGGEVEACRLVGAEPAAIGRGIGELLARSPADAASQGEAARQRMREAMGVEPWARRLADLYEELAC